MGYTKEELLILSLHKKASTDGDVHREFSQQEMVEVSGMSEKQVKCILRTLLQANFLKKLADDSYNLSDNGIRLIETLIL